MLSIKNKILCILAIVPLVGILICSTGIQACEEIEPTGTFSNMRSYEDSGDVEGYEIIIKKSDSGYSGTYRDAEGRPSKFIPIKPNIENGMISFTFEYKIYTGKKYTRKFVGFYNKKGLSGTLSDSKGRIMEQVKLFRLPHKGIWSDSER